MLKICTCLVTSQSKFGCKGEFSGHEHMKGSCSPGMIPPEMATISHRSVRAAPVTTTCCPTHIPAAPQNQTPHSNREAWEKDISKDPSTLVCP